ncbi:hypothetical protein JCM8097_005386 [Rhodosporidiobolus ruineniae]
MSAFRTPALMLRTALRPAARLPPTPGCPGCLAATRSLRHPSSSSSARLLSSAAPVRAGILDQTPNPAVHPAPIPAAPSKPKETARRRVARPRKAALSLSPGAVERIRGLLDSPEPKLIRVGVRNKGCAGMSYHLEYVDKPDKFDEVVEQDGVKVVIDSKALFSIIGSTMDWQEDALQARFVFNNPNIKDACGCGESFIV